MSIYIESERLILRELVETDLPILAEIAVQEHITYWCPDWKDCTSWVNDWYKGKIQWRYSIANPNEEFILLGIVEKVTNKLIGQISTGCEFKDELPGELSVGYYIAKEAMYNGYATEAVKAITQFYFPINKNDFFYAVIKPANTASIRVATKAGFKFVAEMQLPGNEPNETILFNYYRLYRT